MSRKKSPAEKTKRVKIEVKHEFESAEWKEKTEILTRRMKEVELREDEIKAESSAKRAEVKRLKSEVNNLANDLRNGYAMVQVDAVCEFNRKKGVKKFYHFAPGKPFNGDFIREEAMSEQDFEELDEVEQGKLPLSEVDKPKSEEEPAGAEAGAAGQEPPAGGPEAAGEPPEAAAAA
jgi:hypothetical protein